MKPTTLDGYDKSYTLDCERLLVTLIRGLGPWKESIVLVGGLTPRYLVKAKPPAVPEHAEVGCGRCGRPADPCRRGCISHAGRQPEETCLRARHELQEPEGVMALGSPHGTQRLAAARTARGPSRHEGRQGRSTADGGQHQRVERAALVDGVRPLPEPSRSPPSPSVATGSSPRR